MAVYIQKTAQIRIRDAGLSFTAWADFHWDNTNQIWRVATNNDGFFARFTDIKRELTDEDLVLIELKYAGS